MTTATTGSAPARSGALPPALHGPYALVLADLDEIRLGDVLLDTFTGPLLVDEIVRRRQVPVAQFAEHRTVYGDPRTGERHTTERRRVIDHSGTRVRIARTIEAFGPTRGHYTRVRTHNPVRRGCYVLNDGWLAECSCGWPGEKPAVHGGQRSARRAWLEHKADVLTGASCGTHDGCALVAAAEQARELPPIPWSFAFNGAAVARLDELGHQRAAQVAAAWADALGQPLEHGGREGVDTVHVAVPRPNGTRALVAIDDYFKREGAR